MAEDPRKQRLEKEYRGMSDIEMADRIEELMRLRDIALRRARASSSEVVAVLMEELETRLQGVQRAYSTLNAKGHPNIVVATLAELQGQEKEIRTQMRIWRDAKESKKVIDEELEVCNSISIERKQKRTF